MINVEGTPNPNALKFTVGKPVGGPTTFIPGKPTDDPMAQELLALEGVTSVFLTADFVTLSKRPEADWSDIVEAAQAILEEHFS
ncbi:MAG TPA: NifU N-terminal domain-containing protein [Acidimicrobiia bacterium]|nr:NifU N-terminal domain-containing protein [Acidimicrobiia bacterium]